MSSKKKSVDGQNILYHYIQKSVLKEDNDFSRQLIERLIVDLSIWLPVNFYRKLPIILPYVVRDNSCRIKTSSGEDEWGSANSGGFLRDDNSLLKGIVRSFPIRSPKISVYEGRKLGTGFVASHIWGHVTIEGKRLISSRYHLLNSFVPNLVWLPAQVSKLTDREGSFAQRLLQSLSFKIYRDVGLPEELQQIRSKLTPPEKLAEKINVKTVNFFEVPEKWLGERVNQLRLEIQQILSVDKTEASERKIKSSRYLPTLRQIPIEQRQELIQWLTLYSNCLAAEAK